MTLRISDQAANAGIDAITTLLNNGWLRIYSGSQPANADTPPSGTLLAELRFANPAFQAGVAGVAQYNPLTEDSSANSTGTAAWFRTYRSDGTQVVLDGSVGLSDADLIMNALGIALGGRVVCL